MIGLDCMGTVLHGIEDGRIEPHKSTRSDKMQKSSGIPIQSHRWTIQSTTRWTIVNSSQWIQEAFPQYMGSYLKTSWRWLTSNKGVPSR